MGWVLFWRREDACLAADVGWTAMDHHLLLLVALLLEVGKRLTAMSLETA